MEGTSYEDQVNSSEIHLEEVARRMYDTYCKEVGGGLAFNGDPLPHSTEFFEDPTKQKQVDAWRKVATTECLCNQFCTGIK